MSLAYTDVDEDAERLLSFADTSAPSTDNDEWVETHTCCQADSAMNASEIADIPDLDGDELHEDEEQMIPIPSGMTFPFQCGMVSHSIWYGNTIPWWYEISYHMV